MAVCGVANLVDGIDDRLVFGDTLLDWIERRYEREAVLGGVEVLRLRGSVDAPEAS